MTQLRKFRDSISNWFDEIERGVGKRGSTFTDVDAISHDKDDGRFLFREFKQKDEPLSKAQLWVLTDLAKLPRCEVWLVRRIDDSRIGWQRFGAVASEVVISIQEYRRLLGGWWRGEQLVPADYEQVECSVCGLEMCEGHETAAVVPVIHANQIRWG